VRVNLFLCSVEAKTDSWCSRTGIRGLGIAEELWPLDSRMGRLPEARADCPSGPTPHTPAFDFESNIFMKFTTV